MELSKRLNAVAGLVTEGASVADIGTDHGYIPIYLVRNKISPTVIAMDINEGPLERAKEHIEEEGLALYIQTRLSDGCENLKPGEVDTIIAAGMGGALVIRILTAYPEVTTSIREFILQPQSEIARVRRYLWEAGFKIIKEDMIEEDGKYYPIMKAFHGSDPAFKEEEYRYGRILLKERHPVLYEYLKKEEKIKLQIIKNLESQESERSAKRIGELKEDLAWTKKALSVY